MALLSVPPLRLLLHQVAALSVPGVRVACNPEKRYILHIRQAKDLFETCLYETTGTAPEPPCVTSSVVLAHVSCKCIVLAKVSDISGSQPQ